MQPIVFGSKISISVAQATVNVILRIVFMICACHKMIVAPRF